MCQKTISFRQRDNSNIISFFFKQQHFDFFVCVRLIDFYKDELCCYFIIYICKGVNSYCSLFFFKEKSHSCS